MFGIKRATNKFNSKSKCNARTYSYTLPTYVFEPSLSETERKGYRISAEKITQVNEVLSVYRGTKSYHNFTEKKYVIFINCCCCYKNFPTQSDLNPHLSLAITASIYILDHRYNNLRMVHVKNWYSIKVFS